MTTERMMQKFETEETEIRAKFKTVAWQEKTCETGANKREMDLVLRMVKDNMYR